MDWAKTLSLKKPGFDRSTPRRSHSTTGILDFAQHLKLTSSPPCKYLHANSPFEIMHQRTESSTSTPSNPKVTKPVATESSITPTDCQSLELLSQKESLMSVIKADIESNDFPSLKKRERSKSLDLVQEKAAPPVVKHKSCIPNGYAVSDSQAWTNQGTSFSKLYNETTTLCVVLDEASSFSDIREHAHLATEDDHETDGLHMMEFNDEAMMVAASNKTAMYDPVIAFSTTKKTESILDLAQTIPAFQSDFVGTSNEGGYCPRNLALEFGPDLAFDESESVALADVSDNDELMGTSGYDDATTSLQANTDCLLDIIEDILLDDETKIPASASVNSWSTNLSDATRDGDDATFDIEPTPLLESSSKPVPAFATVSHGYVSKDFPSTLPARPSRGSVIEVSIYERACDCETEKERTIQVDYTPLSVISQDPSDALLRRFHESMASTVASMEKLQEWDRANGLPKSHCQTMVNTSRSREQLQCGMVLQKWNGVPLLKLPGAKVKVTRRVFRGNRIADFDEKQGDRIPQAAYARCTA